MQVINPVAVTTAATHTRASTGNAWDVNGTLTAYASDVARYQWNPATGTFEGVLWEPARTNFFLNSATLSTQTRSVASGTVYTVSFYGTGSLSITGTTTVDGASASSRVLAGTGATTRVSLTFTAGATSLTFTVSGSVTKAQLEAGSFATSWITTTGTSATRAADTFSGTGMFNTTFVDATATYAGGTTYARGDVVQKDRRLYESMHAGNTGNTPVSTADAYNPGATYTTGDQVQDDDGIVYTSTNASNTGNTPVSSPADWAIHWLDIGPTNDFAMFDREQSTAGVASNGYPVFAFYVPEEVNAVAFHGIEADTVHVAVSNGAGGLATQTVTVSGGSAWCGDLSVPGGTTGGAVVSVYLERATGVATVGEFVPGTIHTLGDALTGASYGTTSYSRSKEDAWGRTKWRRGGFKKLLRAPVLIDTSDDLTALNNITALLDYLRDTPCSWRLSDQSKFAYMGIVYGALINHDVAIQYPNAQLLNLEVQGLIQD